MTSPSPRSRNITRTWITLLKVSNLIKKSIDQRLRTQFGLSLSRFDILSALDRSGRNGMRAGDLSRMLLVSEGNTTQIMTKLLQDNLVLRRPDPTDARAVIYSLSDEGSALFDEVAKTHRGWLEQTFHGLSDEEAAHLHEVLQHLLPEDWSSKENAA